LKILYVEDNNRDAELARVALARAAPDFKLDIVSSLHAALESLERGPDYDVLLTDMHLPDGDGLRLLTSVRERGWPLAVVIITGGGDESTAVAALKSGADDYIVKRADYLPGLPQTLERACARFRDEMARHARPLHVLYAEDNTADINLTQRHLARHARHVDVEVVYTAAEVLARLPQRGPVAGVDVLLLDYRLPGRNALELLRELLDVRGLDVPVVVVTGQGDEELALQVLRLGASDYVVKTPGYLYKLPSVLENAFHRAQLLREQAALRQSETRYRTLVEQIPAITYMAALDDEGRLQYVSPQAEHILGYTPADYAADGRLWLRQLHPDDAEQVVAGLRRCRETGEPLRLEYRVLHRDGRVLWVRNDAVVVCGPNQQPLCLQGVLVDLTERRQAEAERERLHQQLQSAHARLQALSLRLLDVQESERRHLARELHDEIGQQLTGLKLILDMNAYQPGKPVRASLAEAIDLLGQLMQQVRELSLSLRPAMLDDLGLLPCLIWHLERYTSQTGVQVDFHHSGLENRRLPPQVETAAYRIVQEALTNVARYAQVKQVRVRLWRQAGRLYLEVTDQGTGFDAPAALAAARSNGLAGMSERAALLGGKFKIESSRGSGTRLTATLPLAVSAGEPSG
jgi:PAS domain S-box-containing protein